MMNRTAKQRQTELFDFIITKYVPIMDIDGSGHHHELPTMEWNTGLSWLMENARSPFTVVALPDIRDL